jgi:hypothetical protein
LAIGVGSKFCVCIDNEQEGGQSITRFFCKAGKGHNLAIHAFATGSPSKAYFVAQVTRRTSLLEAPELSTPSFS